LETRRAENLQYIFGWSEIRKPERNGSRGYYGITELLSEEQEDSKETLKRRFLLQYRTGVA
jgi:hypothetical protein